MKETIITTIAFSLSLPITIFSLWYVLTFPVKTPAQIREQTYKMCIDRYTWNIQNTIIGNIEMCKSIKENMPTE